MEQNSGGKTALRDNTSVFRIALIIDLILCQIGYISIPAIASVVLIMIWGLTICVRKYIKSLKINTISYFGWISAFIVSNAVTVLLGDYDMGAFESIGMILNMFIIFFLLFGVHSEAATEEGRKKIYREIFILCRIMLWLSLAVNIVSIISLFVVGRSVTYTFGYLVVYENRFTGIYFNPNLMAFTSFCALFCCHILWQGDFYEKTSGKKLTGLRRAVIAFSAAMNLLVIYLTDSNATLLLMVVYIVIYVIYRLFGGKKLKISSIVKRAASVVTLLAVMTAGSFFVRNIVQQVTTRSMTAVAENIPAAAAPKEILENKDERQKPVEKTENVFEDSDDELNRVTFEHQNKNIDSGRIKLFKQGVNVIKNHPLLGVGKGQIVKYGNRYNNNKMKYSDFHNGYLTIMVCGGIIGFVIFMCFAFSLGKRMADDLFAVSPTIRSDIFPCMAAFIVAYCVYAFFERTLVYDITLMIEFFWLVLGYASVCMVRYEGDSYRVCAFRRGKKTRLRMMRHIKRREPEETEEIEEI